jgi:hypothetical protein
MCYAVEGQGSKSFDKAKKDFVLPFSHAVYLKKAYIFYKSKWGQGKSRKEYQVIRDHAELGRMLVWEE